HSLREEGSFLTLLERGANPKKRGSKQAVAAASTRTIPLFRARGLEAATLAPAQVATPAEPALPPMQAVLPGVPVKSWDVDPDAPPPSDVAAPEQVDAAQPDVVPSPDTAVGAAPDAAPPAASPESAATAD